MTDTEGPESKIAPHSNGKCSPQIPEFYRSALSYESLYPNHAQYKDATICCINQGSRLTCP